MSPRLDDTRFATGPRHGRLVLPFDLHSLTARLVLMLVAIGLAALLVVGLPTAALVGRVLEEQARQRLEQGQAITRTLLAAEQRDLAALALLTAQRPTLRAYLERGETPSMSYLEDLRAASDLAALVVLTPSGRPLAAVGAPSPLAQRAVDILSSRDQLRTGELAIAPDATAFLLAEEAVAASRDGAALGRVRLALALDPAELAQLKEQTGLDHSVVINGQRLVSTLPLPIPRLVASRQSGTVYQLAAPSGDYMAVRSALGGATGVEHEVALSTADLAATSREVHRLLLGSAVVFCLLVAALGYLLAHQITRPLQRLKTASEAMGQGNLTSALPPAGTLTEVVVLTQTLETMRCRLKAAYDELSRANAWSENLIAALTEGVVTVDAAGRITSFSTGAERILGWRGPEVIGRRLEAIFPATLGARSADRLAPGWVARAPVVTRDGRPLMIAMTGGALVSHDDAGYEQALVLRDVTEEEEGLRLRAFFLANVSHEFKTPLAALRAAVEMLATDQPRLSPEETGELTEAILVGVIRLEELVDNLLSSASIQSGQFETRPRPVVLDEVIEEVMLTTRPLLALRGQSLELDIPPAIPPILADPRHLRQVLVNLISNAAKYGPADQPVELGVAVVGDGVRVQVVDKGRALRREGQADLFRPFKRPSMATSTSGVGLGLSIVKTIVERHGGQVGVESSQRGNAFWCTWPLAEDTGDAGTGGG